MSDLVSIGFDQISNGVVVDAGTMADMITNGSNANRTAMAEAISGLMDENPEAGEFSSLVVSGGSTTGQIAVDTGTKTAAATGGAATLNKSSGVVTSEALTTAAGASYTLTLANTKVAAADLPFASVKNGTNTQGTPTITTVNPNANQLVIGVKNVHASEAFNGTIEISFVNFKDAIA